MYLSHLITRKTMTVKRFTIFVLVLAIGCRTYTVQGVECHIAEEPIIFVGGTTDLVIFMWNCSLLSNESLRSVMWLKEDRCIASAKDGGFTSYDSYMGRVQLFGRFGISVHNISRNDSGHYNVVILLNDSLHEYLPCHPTYLPVLPEQCSGFRAGTAPQSAMSEGSSSCDQQRPTKLEIGLICGFLSMTVIIVLSVILWCYCRRRHNANHTGNYGVPPERTQMLQAPKAN